MKKEKQPTTKHFFERVKEDFFYLAEKPMTVFFLIIVFCVFLTFFYFLIARESLKQQEETIELNREAYSQVVARWEEDRKIIETETESRDYFSLFSEAKREDSQEVDGDENEELEETENSENDFTDIQSGDINPERVEELLAETLFEFFEQKEGEMPEIRERAQVWEDLGLGVAHEYRGLYEQNIIFLRTLREAIDD